MYAVEILGSYITRGVYTVSGPFHPFGGAVDIIVVQQPDESFKSSPWNIRFGKFQGVLKTKEKIVNICVNGTDAEFHMYLDHKGEAYFLKDASPNEGESFMSPPSSGDETDEQMKIGRLTNAQSLDRNDSHRESGGQFNMGNGKIVPRMNSQRRRIFGFVFGRRTLKESGNGGKLEPVSSLERAEIAADLLEVKWSTNLSTNDRMGRNCLKGPSDGDGDVGNMVDTEGMFSVQSSDFGLIHGDKIISHHEGIGDNTENNIVTAECIDEASCHDYPDLRTIEELIEIYSSETGVLTDENEVLSNSPKAVEFDMSFKESVTVNPIVDLYNHNFDMLSSDQDCDLAADVSGKGNEHREISSLFYRETSESSNAMHDISGSAAPVVLNSLSEREQDKKNTEPLHEKSHPASEENISELGPPTVKQNSDEYSSENLELNNHMDLIQDNHVTREACEKSAASATSGEYLPTESLSSHDVSFLSSQSIQTEKVDVIEQDTVKEGIVQVMVMDINMLEISEKPCEMDGCSVKPCCSTSGFIVDQKLSSSEDANSHGICVPTGSSCISDEVQEPCNPTKGVKFDNCDFPGNNIISEKYGSCLHVSEGNSDILLSECAEEDHFLLDEIYNFGSNDQPGQLVTAEEIEAEDCPSIALEGNLEDHGSADTRHDVYCADISEVSKVQTSPMPIPKMKRSSKEREQWVGSLPNIRSQVHEFEMFNVHRTSHSLDVKSKTSVWGMPEKDIPCFLNIESTSESNLLQPQPLSDNVDDRQRMGGQNHMLMNPAVEISLCRHLLFEGMGAEAASKAFDAEKVGVEQFAALGRSLVKNDKLVIRIGGRYFPWNAAAPIILGIASFGRDGIFDAEGMIAVDQIDKTSEQDPSSAIVPSGGTWRLWPFNFKKSRSMDPSHLTSNVGGITEKGTETGSMDNKKLCDNSVQKSRVVKKKVRSVTPTSEQLASLNLKEGQNLVTFSFSTAMLGRQQVDARIYLWKWNTRIVISDVDGTITKSDVLGQFMPLVGKDWSQIGVAHLFSAIKENGYQLLFLSARAISQAYLTRQFLFNLKQDGKALPDGPVVISPDGLFPSLYREVIRRAPHEFKIACLEEIRALFPPECNPFYAGFGNRDTDEISYLKVGIPKGKIFIINPKGEVVVNHRVDTKSYTSLHGLVNAIFPAMASAEQEDFNSWNFWKLPLPNIDV
uniref:phosphatidate phosphatase n=1 Tax=Anthurium amnicola TaxID=1678845 RepID=A0A1D1XMY3_9ARAE